MDLAGLKCKFRDPYSVNLDMELGPRILTLSKYSTNSFIISYITLDLLQEP